jgi:hypothetical protein
VGTQHTDTLTAANGDRLDVVVLAIGCVTAPGSLVFNGGTYQLAGGTGQFAGALGQGTVVGQLDVSNHTFSLTFTGVGP